MIYHFFGSFKLNWEFISCTTPHTDSNKYQKVSIFSCPEDCFSSKNRWEGVSGMISSNINKNIRLLYILFPSSFLMPQPLPLCSSKLLQTWPTSLSKRNSCFPPISFFFHLFSLNFHLSSLNFYGLLLLKQCKLAKKTYIFGMRMNKAVYTAASVACGWAGAV